MKRLFLAALAACGLLAASPALAADNVAVTAGSGKTIACKDVSTVCFPQHVEADSTGADATDTTLHAVKTAPQAQEVHLGETGGNQFTIQVAQTVTASSAYASGNAIGGLMTVANAARVSAGSGLLQSVAINSKSAQTTQIDVFIFSANPSGSTCTDKTAFSIAAADFDKVLGVVHVTDWTSGGTPSFGQTQNLAMPYAPASGTSLYACAVTRSSPTYSATSDISLGFRVIRN